MSSNPDRPPPAFTPVPVRARRDGWTPERQACFIADLAQSRCVDEACRRAGLSQQSAYKLRDRPDAASFRAAWADALAAQAVPDGFTGRALGGVVTPVFYAGRRIGERRRHDNRLAMFLLQVHDRTGRWSGPPPDVSRAWPTSALDDLGDDED